MAWVDTMRLRRRADKVRAVGWVNLLFTVIWSIAHASDGELMLALAGVWSVGVMALTYGIAWVIDKHADRVVTR